MSAVRAPYRRSAVQPCKALIGVEIFGSIDASLDCAADVAPYAAEMQQKVRTVAIYVASVKDAGSAVDAQLRSFIPRFREEALTKSAPYKNHWLCANAGGNYAASYKQRTVATFTGIWVNAPSEVVYFPATHEVNERPLNGSNSYIMHGYPREVFRELRLVLKDAPPLPGERSRYAQAWR